MGTFLRQLVLASALVTGLAASGCSHNPMKKDVKVEDARLADIPASQKTGITQAEKQVEQYNQDLTASKQAVTEADNRVKQAETEHEVAKAQLKQAESAQKMKGQDSTELANNTDLAHKTVDASEAKVDYLKSLRDVTHSQKDLAEKQVKLGEAQVEQQKFTTFQANSPNEAAAMKMTAPQFQAKVAERQADVSKVEAKLSKQRLDARNKYAKWTKLDDQLQGGTATERRANVPTPPRG